MYKPNDIDEIGEAQFLMLEAMRGQLELSTANFLKWKGVPVPEDRFTKVDSEDPEVLGFMEAMGRAHHSLGGVHIFALREFTRRKQGKR